MLEVKFLHENGEAFERMEKEKLDVILQHKPLIEIEAKTYEIEFVNYDVDSGLFMVLLRDN